MGILPKKVIAGILAVVLIGFSLGIRIAHPQGGLKNGLGSAESGLVIYKKSEITTAGTKVIVQFDKPQKSPILAVISANTQDAVVVQTGTKLENIKVTQIKGELLVMVPFLGSVLGLIGL